MAVWGCPVYVILEPSYTQQNGKKIPRWKPRSCQAVFLLGLSPKYTSTVHLVLNPATSHHILPQFYVIFDNPFSTKQVRCIICWKVWIYVSNLVLVVFHST